MSISRRTMQTILLTRSLLLGTHSHGAKTRFTICHNVDLVQEAFAVGPSSSKHTPLRQANDFRVTSVAISLTSFADDVAATKPAQTSAPSSTKREQVAPDLQIGASVCS